MRVSKNSLLSFNKPDPHFLVDVDQFFAAGTQDIELDLTMEVELVSSVGNISLAEFLVGTWEWDRNPYAEFSFGPGP